MAELRIQDRLQPSLLDRLTDQTPSLMVIDGRFRRDALRAAGITVQTIIDDLAAEGIEQTGEIDRTTREVHIQFACRRVFRGAEHFERTQLRSGTPIGDVGDYSYQRRTVSAEGRTERVFSMRRLRQSVLRDLTWLLNTACFAQGPSGRAILERAPEIGSSVINYGVPDLTGMYAQGVSTRVMEEALAQAIKDFEPRIEAETLRVTAELHGDRMSRSTLNFVITGDLWGQPLAEELYLQTVVDLSTGHATVTDETKART